MSSDEQQCISAEPQLAKYKTTKRETGMTRAFSHLPRPPPSPRSWWQLKGTHTEALKCPSPRDSRRNLAGPPQCLPAGAWQPACTSAGPEVRVHALTHSGSCPAACACLSVLPVSRPSQDWQPPAGRPSSRLLRPEPAISYAGIAPGAGGGEWDACPVLPP